MWAAVRLSAAVQPGYWGCRLQTQRVCMRPHVLQGRPVCCVPAAKQAATPQGTALSGVGHPPVLSTLGHQGQGLTAHKLRTRVCACAPSPSPPPLPP